MNPDIQGRKKLGSIDVPLGQELSKYRFSEAEQLGGIAFNHESQFDGQREFHQSLSKVGKDKINQVDDQVIIFD